MNSTYNVGFLATRLQRDAVNPDFYSIGGYAEGAYCLHQDQAGSWQTYIGERGEKQDLRTYANEADACISFLGLMAWTECHAWVTPQHHGDARK